MVYVLQVDPLYVSAIVLAGRVWDAITDPIIGNLSLRTKTRLGRLRPWCVTVSSSVSLCVYYDICTGYCVQFFLVLQSSSYSGSYLIRSGVWSNSLCTTLSSTCASKPC